MRVNLGVMKLGWVWIIVLVEVMALSAEVSPLLTAARYAPIAVATGSLPTADPVPRVSLQPILDFQPFGTAPLAAEPAPVPEDMPALVAEPRGLELLGVLVPNGGTARVLLSMDGGPAQSYGKGDQVPGGGTLQDIAADQIWIDVSGQRQALGFAPRPAPVTAAVPDKDKENVAADPSSDEPADGATVPAEPKPQPAAKRAKTAKAMPQPDLRHLIPGLAETSAKKP